MIRLGGLFSGRNTVGDPATPEVACVRPDPGDRGEESFATRLREVVAHGAAMSPPDPAATGIVTGTVSGAVPADFPGALARGAESEELMPEPPPDVPPATSWAGDLDLSQIALPAGGSSARRSVRVRTRLLGFDASPGIASDPIDAARTTAAEPASVGFLVGWIVVIRGPGRGTAFALGNGVSQIGRGPDQAVRLEFGDTSISRSNHAAIAYDDETNGFFIGHGGKANLVRLNDRPVVSTETLQDRDVIRIGETTLLFVSLCRHDFCWQDGDADGPG